MEPGILLGLLEAEGDALVVAVDVEDDDVDRVPLLHDLRRVLDPLGPGHVGDVDQAVDARLDLDEGPEAGQVADLALDAGADRVAERQHRPRILLGLLHAEGDLLLRLVDLEDHGLDGLADGDDLRGMPDVAGPGHLGDVHQALDARLQLHEGAVVGDRDDLALHPGADRVPLGHLLPGVRLQLLHAEADALALPVDVEDLDLDLAADADHLGRVRDPAVRHVGDVQQAVDAAQVDERPEVGDVLDHALPHLAHGELLHQVLALVRPLVLEDHAAADHDVPPALVELDDLELVALAQQLVDVRHPAERDLAARQEGVDAHQVHDHAALDLLDQGALHRLVGLVGLLDLLPHPHEVGLLLGEHDRALLVLEVLEEDLDFIARAGEFLEFVQGHGALGLEADIQDDGALGDAEDLRLDDLALDDLGHRPFIHREHRLVLALAVILVVQVGPDLEAGGGGVQGGGGNGGGVGAHSGTFTWPRRPGRGQMVEPLRRNGRAGEPGKIARRWGWGQGWGSGKREAGSGKREAGSGKREAGSGKREAGSGKREAGSGKR